MTRHAGRPPESVRSGPDPESFALGGALDHSELAELSPQDAGKLLAHLRRWGIGPAALPSDPLDGE